MKATKKKVEQSMEAGGGVETDLANSDDAPFKFVLFCEGVRQIEPVVSTAVSEEYLTKSCSKKCKTLKYGRTFESVNGQCGHISSHESNQNKRWNSRWWVGRGVREIDLANSDDALSNLFFSVKVFGRLNQLCVNSHFRRIFDEIMFQK
ncbi:hypothetical protein CDAR_509801 [Caerostris darwini]|uniref:Uncharacterized protein n=1 Tax=Caerostris darwini TaxID=1538125 RepID=A0AAV4QK16_9ARAC|nr:hypothetical protein CDAR_509801 [Caerostris darwini]